MDKAVFLDRDGCLIVDREYLSNPEGISFLPGVLSGLKKLQSAGFKLLVVTNQSGVARGYFTESEVREVNRHLTELLEAEDIFLNGIYYCPAHPEAEEIVYRQGLDRRKPAPGMLLEAAQDLEIDLDESFMVGDKLSDMVAGKRAGCATVLLLTGKGRSVVEKFGEQLEAADYVAENFYRAVEWILTAD